MHNTGTLFIYVELFKVIRYILPKQANCQQSFPSTSSESVQAVIKSVIVQFSVCYLHFLLPLHEVSGQKCLDKLLSVSQLAQKLTLLSHLLVLDLPLSRSERTPVDTVQLSQQDLHTDICLLLTTVNKCTYVNK